MEDVRRRVEFENVTVQVQAVHKLYEDVKKKKPKEEPISTTTPEFVELKTLWQLTSSEQSVVARTSCQTWIQLVLEREVEFTYVQNGLLNQVPAAKNLQGIVEAVSRLLQIQLILMEETGSQYQCPYNIRTPPHPFISILTTRPRDSWVLLQQEVSLLLASADRRISSKAVDILDPFLRYVLLLPKQPPEYTSLRAGLMSTLTNAVIEAEDDTTRSRLFDYLVDMMQGLQISTTSAVFEVSQLCHSLLKLPVTCHSLTGDSTRKLVNFTLTLVDRCHTNNISFTSLTHCVLMLGRKHPEAVQDENNVAVIGQLMLRTYFPDNANLLNIVKLILTTSTALCPLSVGMVVLPTLNILATSKMAIIATQHKLMTSLAGEVITLLESHQVKNKTNKTSVKADNRQLCGDGYQTQMCTQLANQLSSDTMATINWLTSLQGHLVKLTTVPRSLTNLLAAILVMNQDTTVSKLALDRLVDIARQDVTKAPFLLPLLLYCLGKKSCPTLKLYILEAMPKIATHKVCVPPILKTIQSLGLSSKLKSTCIKLMTELWALQDRCFPHLLKLITDGSTGGHMGSLVDDVTLAKAAAIKQVCKLRPEQHGTDMLGPLSDLLNSCGGEQGAPAAALALEGLYYLCEAEVIDIMSAWGVLESQLLKESRPVVIEKICELFSLVPSLAVKNDEYEVFLSETVRRLWLYSQSTDSQVAVAAYQALSAFSSEHFKISHLQYKYVEDFVQQAEAVIAEQELQTTVDSIIPYVPAVCYIRLLNDMEPRVVDGYEAFLSAMVGKEVENLPRGIHYTSLRQPGLLASQGKAVSSIPSFIQTQYEKTKLPGLRPGLAVSLLFCYDPPLEVGRDGRPRKHYAITHGKNYQQMFNTLLHEVPVQPSEWHRLTLMPQAWGAFMERLFASMLQSRKAEIELQQSREYIDETEADEKKTVVWLWVRDTLVDMIKAATKCNPSIQSNAILALAGLLNIVHRYTTSLDPAELKTAELSTEYKSHSHWLMVVIESLMSLVDFQYKPKGELLGLCQQRSAEDRLPGSLLAQTSASLALAYISPVLITTYVELIYTLLENFKFKLPGQQSSEELSPLVQAFSGLSLGVLLSQLSLECFGDVCGSEGSLETMKALYALEECCFSTVENRTGCLLGLSQAIVSMCKDGKPESRAHVSSVLTKLTDCLVNTEASHPDYQALCVCTSQITGAAFMYNISDTEATDPVLQHIIQVYEKNKENQGVSLSLGLLCHSLTRSGHTAVHKLSEKLFTDWQAAMENEDGSVTSKLAAVSGLMAIVGSETISSQTEASSAVSSGAMNVSSVVSMATKAVSVGGDIGLQGHTAWLLGRLYLSSCSLTENKSAVPTSYSYLPESSFLRAIVDFLTEAGKTGPERGNSRLIEVALNCLQEEVNQPLPPLNWAALLSPLIRLGFGEKIQTLCLQLAVRQCTSSPTAALFLSSWITPPLYNTLTGSSQDVILRSTGTLVRVITPAVLSVYLDRCCKAQCQSSEGPVRVSQTLFTGLREAVALPDPPEAVTTLLRTTVADIFHTLEKEKNVSTLSDLSSCLCHLPDDIIDQIFAADCQGEDSIYRGTFVRCYLVGNGLQPIALLNSCIDAAFNNDKCDREKLVVFLAHCFHKMTTCDKEVARVLNRVQWLLEIMGHVRNIVTQIIPLSNSTADLSQVAEFAVNIISSAICLWTSGGAAAVLGLTSDLFSNKTEEYNWIDIGHMTLRPVELLPSYINGLGREPWSQILPKVLDWLIEMQDLMSTHYQHYLQETILCLRDTKDFQKSSVWTKVKLPRQAEKSL